MARTRSSVDKLTHGNTLKRLHLRLSVTHFRCKEYQYEVSNIPRSLSFQIGRKYRLTVLFYEVILNFPEGRGRYAQELSPRQITSRLASLSDFFPFPPNSEPGPRLHL